MARNNTFIRSQIYNNSIYNIYISESSVYNNTFQNSYLGNFSKIGSYNWSQTPTFFYDNTYLPGTKINNGCFDYPLNNTCEQVFPSGSSSSSSNSIFPYQSIISILITTILLFTFS